MNERMHYELLRSVYHLCVVRLLQRWEMSVVESASSVFHTLQQRAGNVDQPGKGITGMISKSQTLGIFSITRFGRYQQLGFAVHIRQPSNKFLPQLTLRTYSLIERVVRDGCDTKTMAQLTHRPGLHYDQKRRKTIL